MKNGELVLYQLTLREKAKVLHSREYFNKRFEICREIIQKGTHIPFDTSLEII